METETKLVLRLSLSLSKKGSLNYLNTEGT